MSRPMSPEAAAARAPGTRGAQPKVVREARRAAALAKPAPKVHSRNKGVRGELELAATLRNAGFGARRGQQHAGGGDSPDVVCDDLPFIHWEVKRVELLNLDAAMNQAARDCAAGRIPVVAHRKNQQEWRVTLTLADFLLFCSWHTGNPISA